MPHSPNTENRHLELMGRTLTLARQGAGRVSPNPMVGCVVAKSGEIVGEGYHLYDRVDHAEIAALKKAGERADGSDLYVSLEPCSHEGRTPPCTEAIIKSGVRRVFVSTRDPNPLVSGRGVERLRASGIEVIEGLLEEEAVRLNEFFFHYMTTKEPFTVLKLAMSLDGRIAAESGESKWITGKEARECVHRLRFELDGILVGVGTVLVDDPSLDVRLENSNSITKVVLDTQLRTPLDARLFLSGDPVVLFHSGSASSEKIRLLEKKCCLVEVEGCTASGLNWRQVLGKLGEMKLTSLLIEGGSQVATSAVEARVVRRISFFYGSRLLGSGGLPGIGEIGVTELATARKLGNVRLRKLGDDFLVEADIVG